MRSFAVVVCLASMVALAAAGGKFTATVEPGKDSTKPYIVQICMENISGGDLTFSSWGTPFDKYFTAAPGTVTQNDKPVPYQGKVTKREISALKPEKVITLKNGPTGKKCVVVDLRTAFALSKGPFNFSPSFSITEVKKEREGYEAVAAHNFNGGASVAFGAIAEANSAVVMAPAAAGSDVTGLAKRKGSPNSVPPNAPGGPPVMKKVKGSASMSFLESRIHAQRAKGKAGQRVGINAKVDATCNADIFANVANFTGRAEKTLTNIIAKLGAPDNATKALVKLWFKDDDAGSITKVKDVLSKTLTKITGTGTKQITIKCDQTLCDDEIAFIYSSTDPTSTNYWTIHLCDAMKTSTSKDGKNADPHKGTNAHFGVIIHEGTHFHDTGNTEDNGGLYGPAACLGSTKVITQNNADNYEFFVERALATNLITDT